MFGSIGKTIRSVVNSVEDAADSVVAAAPVGLSVHDTLTTNHLSHSILQTLTGDHLITPSSSGVVVPVGLSVHDTLTTNHLSHGILETLTGDHASPKSSGVVVPVGLSVTDTLTTNHLNHNIVTMLTGLDMDVSDPKHLLTDNQASLIKADMNQAAHMWLDHLENAHNVPINIRINITDDDKNHPRADAGPAFVMSTGTGDNATWESAVKYKLETGADPTTGMDGKPKLSDGAQAEIVVNINSNYLKNGGWLDPTPADGSDVPAGKTDLVSVLAHEFGHGLGIGTTMTLDTKTGTFRDGEKSTWESLLDIEKSGTYFTGSQAVKEHGGPVVVTTNTPEENYGHLGNVLSDATDPHTGGPDLMFGAWFNPGQRYEVSDLDVAILQDLGYHTKGPEVHISEMTHPTWLDMHALGSKLRVSEALTHTGDNFFADGLNTAAHAVAKVAGGSFWDHAADAIRHATSNADLLNHGLGNVSLEPMVALQHSLANLHSTGMAGMFADVANHLSDSGLIANQITHVLQDNHAFAQFEAPALHLMDSAMHHYSAMGLV